MRPRGVASIVAVAGALTVHAPAHAIDYALQILPTKVPEAEAPSGWRLSGLMLRRDGPETFGVTLFRTLLDGRANESHGLRAALPVGTVSFDGRRGRWDTQKQLGGVVVARMTVAATGAAEPLEEAWLCRGAFARVNVVLRGTFVLRTRTRFFGTIRRSQLRGVITFNRGGPVDCTFTAPAACTPSTALQASSNQHRLFASPDSGGYLSVSFREPVGRGPVWYHVMSVSRLELLAGRPPTFDVRIPSALPIAGGGTFTARESSESLFGGCRTTTVRGSFSGTFRTRFAGWGARTLAVNTDDASYREAR